MRKEYDFTAAKKNPYAANLKSKLPFDLTKNQSVTLSRYRKKIDNEPRCLVIGLIDGEHCAERLEETASNYPMVRTPIGAAPLKL